MALARQRAGYSFSTGGHRMRLVTRFTIVGFLLGSLLTACGSGGTPSAGAGGRGGGSGAGGGASGGATQTAGGGGGGVGAAGKTGPAGPSTSPDGGAAGARGQSKLHAGPRGHHHASTPTAGPLPSGD